MQKDIGWMQDLNVMKYLLIRKINIMTKKLTLIFQQLLL